MINEGIYSMSSSSLFEVWTSPQDERGEKRERDKKNISGLENWKRNDMKKY